jgi:hypothetical protein
VTSFASPATADGVLTSIAVSFAMPTPASHSFHAKPGASALSLSIDS